MSCDICKCPRLLQEPFLTTCNRYSANFYNVLNDYEDELPEMVDWIQQELEDAGQASEKVKP